MSDGEFRPGSEMTLYGKMIERRLGRLGLNDSLAGKRGRRCSDPPWSPYSTWGRLPTVGMVSSGRRWLARASTRSLAAHEASGGRRSRGGTAQWSYVGSCGLPLSFKHLLPLRMVGAARFSVCGPHRGHMDVFHYSPHWRMTGGDGGFSNNVGARRQ